MLFGSSRILKFNERGLLPAVIQDYNDKKVLMYVHMTREAVRRTRKTGELWLYHRKRKKTWKKGDQSGKTMKVVDMFLHHDRDILLVQVFSKGAACHTGHESCFYHSYLQEPGVKPEEVSPAAPEKAGLSELKKLFENEDLADQIEIVENPDNDIEFSRKDFSPAHSKETEQQELPEQASNSSDPMRNLFNKIQQDLGAKNRKSYSAILADSGPEKISQKIGEDAMQLVASAVQNDHGEIIEKGANIIHHILLLLAERKISLEDFTKQLEEN